MTNGDEARYQAGLDETSRKNAGHSGTEACHWTSREALTAEELVANGPGQKASRSAMSAVVGCKILVQKILARDPLRCRIVITRRIRCHLRLHGVRPKSGLNLLASSWVSGAWVELSA